MRKKNILIVTLVISIFLTSTMFSSPAVNINVLNTPEELDIEKKVYDGVNWVDQIEAELEDIVSFKITITYHKTTHPNAVYLKDFYIMDILPPCLEYADNAMVNGFAMEPEISGNILFWNLTGGVYYLSDGESHVIEFDAEVVDYGLNINNVFATATETCSGIPFEGSAQATVNVPSPCPGQMICEKKVWDTGIGDWVDTTNAYVGDSVNFRIRVEYQGVNSLSDIKIKDTLPPCLEYANDATPAPTGMNANVIFWNLSDTLYDDDYVTILFKANVISEGVNENVVNITGEEEGFGTKYCNDTATVIAEVQADPDIDVEKKVRDGCDWVEMVYAKQQETVTFNITVENTGNILLNDVFVNDTLPESLEYLPGSAIVNEIPMEPLILDSGKLLVWYFQQLTAGEKIFIEFDATVIGVACSVDVNWVEVIGSYTCASTVSDEDSATVKVEGMCMEKEVWDKTTSSWSEETESYIGDTVRFRITTYYYGDYKLYNIKIKDELPDCFTYADNAIPEEPEISGNTLWWNLSDELYDGDSLVIEFDAYVVDGECQQEGCINWAYIIADECSGQVLEWQDPATVFVECGLVADAGGPYFADLDEQINIVGSGSGGTPPYTYEWDLDNDGEYDDATGKEITHSWNEKGAFEFGLKITDDEGKTDTDKTAAIIENDPPSKPSKPAGPTKGKGGVTYKYSSSATEPDGNQIYYMFDWGDGTNSGWIGPCDSGEVCEEAHSWTRQGNYNIRVKAKDIYDEESPWSDPLGISMPKGKLLIRNQFLMQLFYRLAEKFPILEQIFAL